MDPNLYSEDYLSRSYSDSDSEGYCCGQAEEMEHNYRRQQRKMQRHPYNNTPRATAARTKKQIAGLYDGGALDSQISSQEYIDGLQAAAGASITPPTSRVTPVKTEQLNSPIARRAARREGRPLTPLVLPHALAPPIERVSDPFAPTNVSQEIAALRLENTRLRLEMEKRMGEYCTKLEQLTTELEDCKVRLGRWSELASGARAFFGETRLSLDRLLTNLDDTEANV